MTVQSAQHKIEIITEQSYHPHPEKEKKSNKISNPESRLLKPIICITCDRRNQGPTPKNTTKIRPARPEVFIKEALVQSIIQAGGVPFLIPPLSTSIDNIVEHILQISDGVVISGGAFDISPHHYGQSQKSRLDHIDENRTGLELPVARRCVEEQKPLLGICGGMQVMAVATGEV